MKIVVLDGYTENPGDLSWEPISSLGEFTVYDRTPDDDTDPPYLQPDTMWWTMSMQLRRVSR